MRRWLCSSCIYLAHDAAWVSQQREWQPVAVCKCLVVSWSVTADAKHLSTSISKGLILVTELAGLHEKDSRNSRCQTHTVTDDLSDRDNRVHLLAKYVAAWESVLYSEVNVLPWQLRFMVGGLLWA